MLIIVLLFIIIAISLNYFNQNALESTGSFSSKGDIGTSFNSTSSFSANASNLNSTLPVKTLSEQKISILSTTPLGVVTTFWKRISVVLLICTLPLLWEGRAYEDIYLYNGLLLITNKLNLVVWLLFIVGLSLITTLSVCTVKDNFATPVQLMSSLLEESGQNERIVFTLCAILGGIILNSATDFLTILLGLELQSYSVYILAASYRNYEPSEAAGLKYFLLGALSSALVFMGLAIFYAYSGSTNLETAFLMISSISNQDVTTESSQGDAILPYIGTILILAGISWKVAAAPVQAWSIDVYDAVPTRTTAVLSLLPKVALFSLLIRLISMISTDSSQVNPADTNNFTQFIYSSSGSETGLQIIILVIALSLIVGSVAGLFQPRIKRLLAYSSVLNVGFILMGALLSNSTLDSYNPTLYIIQYIITTAAIWLCLINLSNVSTLYNLNSTSTVNVSDITLISQLQGIHSDRTINYLEKSRSVLGLVSRRSTIIAVCLTVLILSTAGIPPMVGFYAKYSIIILALQSGYTTLALIAVGASIISTVYYLGVIRAIWGKSSLSSNDMSHKYGLSLYIASMNNELNGQNSKEVYESTLFISFYTLIIVLYLLQYSVVYVLLSL